MDSTPTPIKESSFKTSQAQETTQLTFKGESSHNTPLTPRYLEGNKGIKSNCETEHNLTSKNHRCKPLVSSNTSTTASVIVTPTDNNAAHLIPNLLNGVVSEPANSKVKLSNTNADGMLNLINELKIELNNQRNSYTEKKNIK